MTIAKFVSHTTDPPPLLYAIDHTISVMAISCKSHQAAESGAGNGNGKRIFTDGVDAKGTRAHTHRELIREWLWKPEGSSLE